MPAKIRPISILFLALATTIALAAGTRGAERPLEPDETLGSLVLADGVRIELVACEPEVVDPIAIRFDEDGRLWVVEMHDYPTGPAEGEPPQSRIRVLEDRDGDGRFETSRVFAEGLLFATGLQPWRCGAIVTLAGRVVYLADRNGDGRADHEETWFTGFSEQNSQLRANHPRLALDNRVYVANGLRGGNVVDQRVEEAPPVSISGMDFRFDPLGDECVAVSGMAQYGITFDDFGRRFLVSNRNPLQHVVLEDRYLRRNPLLGVSAVVHDVAAYGEKSRVFPLTSAFTTSTLHAGQFTAACGVLVYRGTALPDAMRGDAFVCEPTGNLVRREIVAPHGATFASRPAREGVEFLASIDEWFRPVFLETGPDGALYVVDMYRRVIEHPDWMPEEQVRHSDFEGGKDHGRIYRIVADDDRPRRASPRLSECSTDELVEHLRDDDAWWRETAARLLLERQDSTAGAALERLAAEGESDAARVQALWSLDGLGLLTEAIVSRALDDRSPRVRESALQLAERWLGESPSLVDRAVELADDDDPRLRFQVALSLGEVPQSESADAAILMALRSIGTRDEADHWTRIAVASSIGDRADELVVELLRAGSDDQTAKQWTPLLVDLCQLVGAGRDQDRCGRVLRAVAAVPAETQTAVPLAEAALKGLGGGLVRRGDWLVAMIDAMAGDDAHLAGQIDRIFAAAAVRAGDDTADDAQRRDAIELLRHARYEHAGPVLLDLAVQAASQNVQLAAIGALADHRDPEIAPALLADFQAHTPAVRRAILDALLATPDRSAALLDHIAEGTMPASELDPARTAQLLRHRDQTIRQRAEELLSAVSADRQRVLAEYQPALTMQADPHRGREVFRQHCSTCHRMDGIGVDVGPDVSDSRTKTPAQLLTDILLPNQAIDGSYVSYTAITTDGRVLSGLIQAETASSVTLRQAENKTVTLLREDIDELRSTGVSLMPEGLEQNIPVQAMADLIRFIKEWRFLESPVGRASSE